MLDRYVFWILFSWTLSLPKNLKDVDLQDDYDDYYDGINRKPSQNYSGSKISYFEIPNESSYYSM